MSNQGWNKPWNIQFLTRKALIFKKLKIVEHLRGFCGGQYVEQYLLRLHL